MDLTRIKKSLYLTKQVLDVANKLAGFYGGSLSSMVRLLILEKGRELGLIED